MPSTINQKTPEPMNKTGMIRQSTLARFGVKTTGTYESKLHKSFITDLQDGILNQYQMAIVAQFGAGKSQLMHMLQASYKNINVRPVFIHIVSPDKKRLTIGAVVDAMLMHLGVKEPGRSVNTKTVHLITALGTHLKDTNRPVCLVIDNAHRCDLELFSEIRDLREQQFNGIFPLFSVIFIGQEGLQTKLNRRKEVGWRTQFHHMNERGGWWTYEERIAYLQSVYGTAITEAARQNIAAKTTVPLEIDRLVGDSMEKARTAGMSVINDQVVLSTDQEVLAGQGISYADIAAKAGVSKASVSNYINGQPQSEATKEKVSAALTEFIKKDTPAYHTGS